MEVTVGKEGLTKTWQAEFPETTKCVHEGCGGEARIGFVAHEGLDGILKPPDGEVHGKDLNGQPFVCSLHENDPKGEGFWLHDCCAVAVYFCKKCLSPTALYNQG